MAFSLSNLQVMSYLIETSNESPAVFGESIQEVRGVIERFILITLDESEARPLECPVCVQERAATKTLIELYVRETGSNDGCPFRLDPMRFCDATWATENR